jgi:hypothetical protein
MIKRPIVELKDTLKNSNIVVLVGEAGESKCSGTLTVIITDVQNGQPQTFTSNVTNLSCPLQEILFGGIPTTSKIHTVTATLVLDTKECKYDTKMIEFPKR